MRHTRAPEGCSGSFAIFWQTVRAARPVISGSPGLPLTAASQRHRRDRVPNGPMADDVVLEVRNLSRAFGGLKAVQMSAFKLRRNEILGIIGPNGAGKTTVFICSTASCGRIMANSHRRSQHVGPQAPRTLRSGIGRTFQIMRPFLRMSIADMWWSAPTYDKDGRRSQATGGRGGCPGRPV